jgi:hypothetical protein
VLLACVHAIHKSLNGFGLIAHGLKGCLKFECHVIFGIEMVGNSHLMDTERAFYFITLSSVFLNAPGQICVFDRTLTLFAVFEVPLTHNDLAAQM